MTNRERVRAVLNYESYDRLPIVHFGFWRETLRRWQHEGHVTLEEAEGWTDECSIDGVIARRLGFDLNWNYCHRLDCGLLPEFERQVLRELPGGIREVRDGDGSVVLEKDGVTSIPAEIDHLLKDRASWEGLYLPRLRFSKERVYAPRRNRGTPLSPLSAAGLEYLRSPEREEPVGLYCGSLFGRMRNWLGVKGVSYLAADDAKLFDEIIDTVGQLCYDCVKEMLSTGASFDYAHFWEDICCKTGPLVVPSVFREKVGPHYRRIVELTRAHGIDIASVDCDGRIDALIPVWFENGVNTMFPIEVGTWGASIAPWREEYGKELRGVGGVNKNVFSRDYAAVDEEVERLKPLVDLGGFLPCLDHRIAPDARWENVQYYCERMRATFG